VTKYTKAAAKVLKGDSHSTGVLLTAIPDKKTYKQIKNCVSMLGLSAVDGNSPSVDPAVSPLLNCTADSKKNIF